jgi:hypothetical protein
VGFFYTRPNIFALIRRHPRLALVQLLVALLVALPAFMATMSFIAAKTPEQATAQGTPLPEGWTAGVMNHGAWYRWWTIQQSPALFGVSVFGLAVSALFIWGSLIWSWRDDARLRR